MFCSLRHRDDTEHDLSPKTMPHFTLLDNVGGSIQRRNIKASMMKRNVDGTAWPYSISTLKALTNMEFLETYQSLPWQVS